MSEHRLADDPSVPTNERSSLIEQVLLTHIQQQLQGENVFDDDLAAKHPDLMPELEERLQLFREMADLRATNAAMDAATSGSDIGMLNVRCPHCRESVRVPADAFLNDITCSGCGSHFSLADENADKTRAAALTKQLGHFELVEQIGAGSFASVWKARDNELDRWVAVKIPRHGKLESAEVTQFLREARAVAQLSHPNIVSVHEVGREGDTVFIVSDLVRGVSLSDWLTAQRPSVRETCTLCATIADALHHAHEAGVIHRDLKPQNIMLDKMGEPHVLDFGLARRGSGEISMTLDGRVLGTPAYMPPEQARGEAHQVGREADIYSLGVILFELLTGDLPFRGNARMLMHQVLHDEAPSPRKLNSGIPKDLETICLKCLEKEPNRRYETANEVADELQRILAGEAIHARPISPIERVARWSWRNRGMTAALTSIAALLILGTVASMMSAMHSSKLRDEAEYNRDAAEYNRYVAFIFATNYRTEKGSRSAIHARKSLAAARHLKYRNWEWAYLANKVWRPRASDTQQTVYGKQASNSAEFWKLGVPKVDIEIVPRNAAGTGMMAGKYNTNGTALVFTLGDGSAGLHSLATGESFFLRKPDSTFFDMTSSPNDSRLVTSVLTGGAIIYDAATKEPIITSPEDSMIPQATWIWSPDSAYVLSLHADPTIRIWDATTLDPDSVVVLRNDDPDSGFLETSDIRFSESGDELWSAAIDGTICKWSFPKGELLDTIEAPASEGMTDHAISPNGTTAVAAFEDGSSFLWEINWEVETKVSRQLSGRTQDNTAIMRGTLATFSHDGTCVAVINDDLLTATIYDVAMGKRICQIEGHSAELKTVQFSPDGESLLTVSDDGTAKIWTSRPVPVRDVPTFANAHSDLIFQIDFDRYGKRLLSGSFDGTARVWDLKTRRLIATYVGHDAPVVAVDFNVDGKRAASLDAVGVLHVWDPVTGNQIFHIDPRSDQFARHIRATGGRITGDMMYFPGVLSTGLFTPDGTRVVTFQKEAMKVFRADDGTFEVSLAGSTDHGWPVFNHDSTLVSILEMYGRHSRVWNLHTGQLVASKPLDGRHSTSLAMVAFSPVDDKIVSGDMGGSVILRNGRTGELLHPPWKTKFGIVDSCRFSVDGRFVLAGYSNGLCRVLDAESAEVVTTLTGHLGMIRDVRVSPDGTRLLSWASDDRAMVWDLARPSANQLVVLSGESRLMQAHWSPDGRDIVTAWSDGSIGVWSGATKNDLASLVSHAEDFEESFGVWHENLANAKEH